MYKDLVFRKVRKQEFYPQNCIFSEITISSWIFFDEKNAVKLVVHNAFCDEIIATVHIHFDVFCQLIN